MNNQISNSPIRRPEDLPALIRLLQGLGMCRGVVPGDARPEIFEEVEKAVRDVLASTILRSDICDRLGCSDEILAAFIATKQVIPVLADDELGLGERFGAGTAKRVLDRFGSKLDPDWQGPHQPMTIATAAHLLGFAESDVAVHVLQHPYLVTRLADPPQYSTLWVNLDRLAGSLGRWERSILRVGPDLRKELREKKRKEEREKAPKAVREPKVQPGPATRQLASNAAVQPHELLPLLHEIGLCRDIALDPDGLLDWRNETTKATIEKAAKQVLSGKIPEIATRDGACKQLGCSNDVLNKFIEEGHLFPFSISNALVLGDLFRISDVQRVLERFATAIPRQGSKREVVTFATAATRLGYSEADIAAQVLNDLSLITRLPKRLACDGIWVDLEELDGSMSRSGRPLTEAGQLIAQERRQKAEEERRVQHERALLDQQEKQIQQERREQAAREKAALKDQKLQERLAERARLKEERQAQRDRAAREKQSLREQQEQEKQARRAQKEQEKLARRGQEAQIEMFDLEEHARRERLEQTAREKRALQAQRAQERAAKQEQREREAQAKREQKAQERLALKEQKAQAARQALREQRAEKKRAKRDKLKAAAREKKAAAQKAKAALDTKRKEAARKLQQEEHVQERLERRRLLLSGQSARRLVAEAGIEPVALIPSLQEIGLCLDVHVGPDGLPDWQNASVRNAVEHAARSVLDFSGRIGGLLSSEMVRELIGCGEEVFDRFVEKGLLQPRGINNPLGLGPLFNRDAATGLIKQFETGFRRGVFRDPRRMTFAMAAKHLGLSEADVAIHVLETPRLITYVPKPFSCDGIWVHLDLLAESISQPRPSKTKGKGSPKKHLAPPVAAARTVRVGRVVQSRSKPTGKGKGAREPTVRTDRKSMPLPVPLTRFASQAVLSKSAVSHLVRDGEIITTPGDRKSLSRPHAERFLRRFVSLPEVQAHWDGGDQIAAALALAQIAPSFPLESVGVAIYTRKYVTTIAKAFGEQGRQAPEL
ncbi:hypothetical protein ACVIGB_000036 [Bradyrhizobium sp. USDA 4341]